MSIQRRALRCVAALVVVAALAACSQGGNTQAGTGGGNSWTKPGVLRWAANAEPDNMDPVVGNQQTEVDLSMF
jgi:ABC-type glycerol-3-phosphate transport system substrate-binding protein